MSEGTYKVEQCTGQKDKDGKFGPMRSYYLVIEGEGNVEWFTKATTPEPKPGDVLTGTVSDGQYSKTFKKAQPQGGFGGGGPRPEDPKRSARILRQHSQSTAIATLQLAHAAGVPVFKDMERVGQIVGLVKTLSDVFDKDANDAGDKA